MADIDTLAEVIHKIDELSWELARLKVRAAQIPSLEADLAALRRVKELMDADRPAPPDTEPKNDPPDFSDHL